jgi:hypothetical protein
MRCAVRGRGNGPSASVCRGYGVSRASAIVRPSGGAPSSRGARTGGRAELVFIDSARARLTAIHP